MASSVILNSFYNFIEPIRIDASDWRYDVTQRFGGSIVAQLIGGRPIYQEVGAPLPKKLFVDIGETVHEIHEEGIGRHKYKPAQISFNSGAFIEREFGSEYINTMRDLAKIQYVSGRNVFADYFDTAVSDFARHSDRMLLGCLSGIMPVIEEGIDIQNKMIDNISQDTVLNKLPTSRYVPLNFDRFELLDPHFTNDGWRKEGLTISKLEAVYTALNKYATRGQILLFVGKSALVTLEQQRVLTSSQYANTMGLTVVPTAISSGPTIYNYRGGALTIIGLPDNHMPDPVSEYHIVDSAGDVNLLTGKGTLVDSNELAINNITYGYAMISNDVSLSWGMIGNIVQDGLASWQNVLNSVGQGEAAKNLVATGLRPRYIVNDLDEELRVRMSQTLFASRNRPETVVIVELAANPMIDIEHTNNQRAIPVKTMGLDTVNVNITNDKLNVVQQNIVNNLEEQNND